MEMAVFFDAVWARLGLHKEPKKARCQNGTCAQKLQNFILVKAEGSIFFI